MMHIYIYILQACLFNTGSSMRCLQYTGFNDPSGLKWGTNKSKSQEHDQALVKKEAFREK